MNKNRERENRMMIRDLEKSVQLPWQARLALWSLTPWVSTRGRAVTIGILLSVGWGTLGYKAVDILNQF